MNARSAVALSIIVVVLVAGTFLVAVQLGFTTGNRPSATVGTTTTTALSATTVRTGGTYADTQRNLQLLLAVNASSSGGPDGNVTIQIAVDEYNPLAATNNVTMATAWGLDGLSLGSCGTGAYPFGVALYKGAYTAGNVSEAQPLQIYPAVPCPLLLRLVTGYVFQPASDLAVVLPSGPNTTALPMSSNVTATAEYDGGVYSSSVPLGPGTYTVAAGDEWGSIVTVHFTVGTGATTSTLGTLEAHAVAVSAAALPDTLIRPDLPRAQPHAPD